MYYFLHCLVISFFVTCLSLCAVRLDIILQHRTLVAEQHAHSWPPKTTYRDYRIVRGRVVVLRHVDVENKRVVVGKARNDAALEAADAQHAAPVLAVDADRGPAVGPVLAEARARVLGERAVELRGVEFRVLEAGPDARDVGGVGGDAQAQAAVHVGGELEPRRLGRGGGGAGAGAAGGRGLGELGEAVRDGLELQQRRQLDVHVGLAHLGLHNGLDRLGVQHPHGNVLRDDLFVLPAQRRLEVLGVEELVVVARGKRVVIVDCRCGACLRASLGGRGGGRCGGDCEGEHGQAVLFGEAQGGGDAVEGRLERALQRLQRELEVDGVGGFRGLDVVVFKDEVHGEGAGGMLAVILPDWRASGWR